ncbi:hypothetical protein [Methylobacterium tardum]|nr:hypothetical protein [Methylobacterium tardum]URD39301.1 hypothetical protein M6G65_13350 [Methylobacterium tardum]
MEVDHFLCKSNHAHLVVDWFNLLPSCKRCNVQKGGYDVIAEGDIVDPTRANPKDHLCLKNYRFKHLSTEGENTIEVLDLNNSLRMTKVRFEIGESINERLLDADTIYRQVLGAVRPMRPLRRLTRTIEGLLDECGPTREYSATASTILTGSDIYIKLKAYLEAQGQWTITMGIAHAVAVDAAMPCTN